MRLKRSGMWGAGLMLASATALFAAIPPGPGVINFVEGQATIDGRTISNSSVGTAQLQTGGVLSTANGRAEVLLSPGVFLRLAQNSEVRMLSSDLLDTRVALDRGSAMVEADQLHKEGRIRVEDQGSEVTLLSNGLYRFSADNPSVAVYDGKAQVMENDREVEVKRGHELNLTAPAKAQKFDAKRSESGDPLYAWSKLRSEYMSEASAATSRTYIVNNWGGWYGPGWYWNPFWATYAWLPGGPVFYSPFGWGYYSPYAFVAGGYYVYPRYHRGGFTRRYSGIQPGVMTRSSISGFRSGGVGISGFHGGGGGIGRGR